VRVTHGGDSSLGRSGRLTGPIPGRSGHLAAAASFVIERVESFEAHTRTDLDYTAEAGWYEKEGCKFGALRDHSHVSIAYPDDATNRRSLSRGGRTMEKRPGRSETRNEWQWSR